MKVVASMYAKPPRMATAPPLTAALLLAKWQPRTLSAPPSSSTAPPSPLDAPPVSVTPTSPNVALSGTSKMPPEPCASSTTAPVPFRASIVTAASVVLKLQKRPREVTL